METKRVFTNNAEREIHHRCGEKFRASSKLGVILLQKRMQEVKAEL